MTAENLKAAFDFNDVIENVHLLNIAQAGCHPTEYFLKVLGIDKDHVENAAYMVIGHTATGVTVLVAYDLIVAAPELADL